MGIEITAYNALCNLGANIDAIYKEAINGNASCFEYSNDLIKDQMVRIAKITTPLDDIENLKFNLRCNKLILKTLSLLDEKIFELKGRIASSDIAVLVATTNSGVEEFEVSRNMEHSELGNPALFVKKYLNLSGYYATVSTACSSGLRVFSVARNLFNSGIAKAVIVIGVDSISKLSLYGFNSLEVLTSNKINPFSKNRTGMNIGEAVATFILEKDVDNGIEVLGIGESTDVYHQTTPNPTAQEAIIAINQALAEANLQPESIDYINLHGTGTISNDLMESRAISSIFGMNTPVSSTKALTGHCLGAAASIEMALCCKLLDDFDGRLYPHIYDGEYDDTLGKMNLVTKDKYLKCNICMCNSFGFGGTNSIIIIGKNK